MDFEAYSGQWVKQELNQAYIMIGIGLMLAAAIYFMWKGGHDVLRGMVWPVALIALSLIVYGSYIMQSRPAHSQASIALYESNAEEALEHERSKHLNDNKIGKTLLKYVYPGLMLLGGLGLLLLQSPYQRGIALGIVLLGISNYIMDYGFVSRSDAFIDFIDTLKPAR